MKIAQVCYKYPPLYSGYGKQLYKINEKGLKDFKDFSIFVLTLTPKSFETLDKSVISIRKVRSNEDINFFDSLIYSIKTFIWLIKNRKKYDVIHCLSAYFNTSIPSVLAAMITRKQVIVKITQAEYRRDYRSKTNPRFWLKKLRKRVVKRANIFIAISDQIKDELILEGISAHQIKNIPNSVDTEKYKPMKSKDEKKKRKQQMGISENGINLLFVGLINRRKGFYDLVNALDTINVNKSINVYVCGPVEDDIDKLNLKKNKKVAYHILGNVDNVLDYYQTMDVFVFPSYSEGLPNALLEAVSSGLPSVVSNIGGNTDIIKNEKNGLTFIKGDVNDLRLKIEEMINNNELRLQFANNSRKSIIRFDIKKITNQYYGLYNNVINKKEC